ncbi:MAG: hypothetical protein KGL39_25365 [Patescibacteria group bacterium]|nr:hypothetical protein [Patescibacteria group bacterium]
MATLTESKMGIGARLKSAANTLMTGKKPVANKLSQEPEDKSRASLVIDLNDWCVDTRLFWKPIFNRIRQEQKFAAGKQWPGGSLKETTPDVEEYVGDMIQQLVNRKTAALYSKNPTPEAVLRDRMNFTVWDGQQATIDACHALIAQLVPQATQMAEAEQQGQQVPPPPPQMAQDIKQAQAILADYNQGIAAKAMLQKIADTGEKLIKQQWDAQTPDLLVCGKQATTRIITSRVAYIKVMYKRDMGGTATETANETGLDTKIQTLQSKLKELELPSTNNDDSKIEETRLMKESIQQQIAEMQKAGETPSDEGIVLDWLSATSVLVDPRCKCLKEFIGAHRIAHEILMTVSECEAKFDVSLMDSGAKIYTETADGWKSDDQDNTTDPKDLAEKFGKQLVCVWEVQDKDTGLCYVLCDGVKDFLKEPAMNEPEVNRFWSIVGVTFNSQEVETNDPDNDATIYPRSDVRLMMPMQINVNRAGNEKRSHRSANRPAWLTFGSAWAGAQGESDLKKLSSPRDAHDVFRLQSLDPNSKIGDLIVPLPKQPFDDNLYDTGHDTQAMMLATGQQASDLGQQAPNEKATGQNIAAQASATSESSNIDDLNFAWSTVAQMMWEMLIDPNGMSQAIVQKLVGKGATWPDLNREDIADSIYFRIEAGSMGRPNQQANLQKIQTLMPQLIQLFAAMNKNPEPLAKMVLKEFDANIDLDQLLKDAQVLPPPAPPQQPPPKPPSLAMTLNYQNLTPEEQAQAVQQFGIKPASPASKLIEKVGHGAAIKAAHENNLPPQPQKPVTQK